MPNILVTGSRGQLGSELKILNDRCLMLNYNCFFTDRDELDITDKNSIEQFVKENDIDIIINCAAYTAVDKAEEEKELAEMINNKAVKHLAEISKERDIFLIHISTDYVFDGKNHKPYTEEDAVNPNGVYGATKLAGEKVMQEINPKNAIIIRTSWVYSSFGANFVKTMLRLKDKKELNVVFDQIGTPTYARDLAEAILQVMSYELGVMNEENENNKKIIHNSTLNTHNSVMIYHYSNEGVCSWYDFAKAIFEIKGIDIKINPIKTKDYPTPAKRPHYSVLNKSKIKKEFNIEIPYWKDSLKRMLDERF